MATSNLRKAAILLNALPTALAAELRGKLAPEHEDAVAAEMQSIGKIDVAEQEAVMREFAGVSAESLGQLRPAPYTPFRFLHDVETDALLDLIADEHPQTIAVVLSYLPPTQAAAVLAELDADRQLSVICRLATMKAPSLEAVRDVEQGLRSRLVGAVAVEPPRGASGVSSVVEMFHAMEPSAERRLLSRLAEAEPELVRAIRSAMFGIDLTSPAENVAEPVAC